MLTIRTVVFLLTITAVSVWLVPATSAADQDSANTGPVFGTWEFSGKDNTGLTWSGTLKIAQVDPDRYGPKKYHSLCSLDVVSTDPTKGTRGVEAVSEWDPGTRIFVFGNRPPASNVYTAVLSPDGKSLSNGKWTESKVDRGQAGPVVRTGQWSAKLSHK